MQLLVETLCETFVLGLTDDTGSSAEEDERVRDGHRHLAL